MKGTNNFVHVCIYMIQFFVHENKLFKSLFKVKLALDGRNVHAYYINISYTGSNKRLVGDDADM